MRKLCAITLFALIAAFSVPVFADDAGAPVAAEVAGPTEGAIEAPDAEEVTPIGVEPANAEVGDLMVETIKAVEAGNWKLAISGILFLLMFVLRALKLPFLTGDRGGAIGVLTFAILGAFGTALASGAPVTLSLAGGALVVALTAAGGYNVVKRIIWPSDKKEA